MACSKWHGQLEKRGAQPQIYAIQVGWISCFISLLNYKLSKCSLKLREAGPVQTGLTSTLEYKQYSAGSMSFELKLWEEYDHAFNT